MNATGASRCLSAFLAVLLVSLLGACTRPPRLGPTDGADLPPNDLARVKAGDPAPDFTLKNIDGRVMTLSDFAGQKYVLLVIYRGHW